MCRLPNDVLTGERHRPVRRAEKEAEENLAVISVTRNSQEKGRILMRRVDYIVGARDFNTLEAEQFMQDVVTYYHVEDTVDKLAGAMSEGGFGSVPILAADGKLVGIVSEYDLLKAIEAGKELAKVTAGEIMVKNPVTVSPKTPAMEIIHLLQERHFIRTPVVDAEGKLVGVVSRRDIIQGFLRVTKPIRGF